MQRFDLLMVVLLALGLLARWIRPTRDTVLPAVFAGGALLVGVIHLVVEGPRWQMFPAYAVLIATTIFVLGGRSAGLRARLERWQPKRRRGAYTVAYLLLALTIGASYLFPMFVLPKPTGPYAIGTRTLSFVDKDRLEPHTVEPFDHRALNVHVWYPADVAAGQKPVPYLTETDVMAASTLGTLPLETLFTHLDKIPTHAFQDAPLSAAKPSYPVLMFSHGRTSFWGQNMTLMEELASRGYIVFAIDHTYGAAKSVFPDGRVVDFVPEIYETKGPEPKTSEPPVSWEEFQVLMTSLDGAEIRKVVEKMRRLAPRADAKNRYALDIWVADQHFILNQIERLESGDLPSPFAGHLDLSRLGVFGMSQGGSTTILTCATDPRCKAGVSLDGFALPLIDSPPQQAPFMTLNSDFNLNLTLFGRGPSWDYWAHVLGAHHSNFTDLPMVSRVWGLKGALGDVKGGAGPIDPLRMEAILRAYVSAFFDKHLQGKAEPLLDGPSPNYPEVLDFRVKRPS